MDEIARIGKFRIYWVESRDTYWLEIEGGEGMDLDTADFLRFFKPKIDAIERGIDQFWEKEF